MNVNDDSTTSAISHVPAIQMNLTEFQGLLGVMRRMRNISLLCWPPNKVFKTYTPIRVSEFD